MTIIGIAGAYWLTIRNKNISGLWCAFLRVLPFGAVYAISMFWWVLHSIYVVPELTQQFAVWTIPGLLGLGVAGALIFSWPFIAIACIRMNSWGRVFLFSGVWTFVLWLREWAFTGFPWNPVANIMMQFPVIANSMSVWGALGLTFVILGLVVSGVELIVNRKSRLTHGVTAVFIILFAIGAGCGYKNMIMADVGIDEAHIQIRIVQPGQSQVQKATHNKMTAFGCISRDCIPVCGCSR